MQPFLLKLFGPARTAARSCTSAAGTQRVPLRGSKFSLNGFAAQRGFASTFARQQLRWQTVYRRATHRQKRSYGRQAFNYQRFQASSSLFKRWAAHPHFYYHVAGIGGAAGGVYIFNLEEVPVSHRRRFNVVSPEFEASTGKQMYQETMQEYGDKILPAWHPKTRMVKRVLDRLVPHSGLQDEAWEVNVIDSPEKNAFVIPGGKVFFFSGILSTCNGEDGVAAVLGHEIAHNVAHHAAERISQTGILTGFLLLFSLFTGVDAGIGNMLMDLAFRRPGSRAQESEADYIGLLMMSESCYDPSAAMDLWARMEKEEQNAPPQFMSTHPSNHNRLEKIREWLPEAERKREGSACFGMQQYASAFTNTAMKDR